MFNIPAADTLVVLNNFTHNDGYISNGVINVQGNIIIGAGADGGSATIYCNNSAAQTYQSSSTARLAHLKIDKPAGSVTPTGGTTQLALQRFTLLNGSFTAPSGTLYIGGYYGSSQTLLTHSGGTFNHNNGTVSIDPDFSGCTTLTASISSTAVPKIQFFNFTVDVDDLSCLEDILTFAANDTILIENNLLLNDGYLNGGHICVVNDVRVNSGFDGGNTELIFFGSTDQDFDLSGATGNFNGDIKIQKTGGNVLLHSDCILDAPAQDLRFVKGHIVSASTQLLTFEDNTLWSGASDSSFVSGPIRKVGNDMFTFPIGKNDSLYAPLGISAPSNTTHHFTAEYFPSNPHLSAYDTSLHQASLHHISGCEYWILDRTNGNSNVFVTLSWDARSCGVDNLSELSVTKWNGTQWIDLGQANIAGNANSGSIRTLNLVGTFSPFTLSSYTENNPLPVTLLNFDAEKVEQETLLSWTTLGEINSDVFEVEHSTDTEHYTKIGTVKASGNSNSSITYQFTHKNPSIGLNYYRLKMKDLDGTYEYTKNIALLFETDIDFNVRLFPNPTKDKKCTIEINGSRHSIELNLFNNLGIKVFSAFISSTHQFDFSNLAPGLYTIQLTVGVDIVTEKILIN